MAFISAQCTYTIFRRSHRKAINVWSFYLVQKCSCVWQTFPAPHEKIKNMHAVCHGCNTKIASTEGESSYYHWRSTQEVWLVSTFCSSFHRKLEKSQTILVINMLRCPMILILYTVTPNSPWAPVIQQCFRYGHATASSKKHQNIYY